MYLDIFPFFFYFGEQVSQTDVVFEYAKFSVHPNIGDQNIGLQTIRQDYYVDSQYSFEATRQSRYDRKLLLMRIPVFIRLFLSFNVRFPSILNFQEVPAGVLRKADLAIHRQGA